MRRRGRILLLLALLISVPLIGLFLWRELGYESAQLSRCLRDLQDPSALVQHRAQESLRRLGPGAVPALQRKLHARDVPAFTNVVQFLQRQSFVKIPFVPARQRRIQAAIGCVILGPDATPAIPDLIAFSREDGYCLNLAQSALSQLGPAGVRPLTLALTNKDPAVRMLVVGALVHIGPEVVHVTPALINSLADDAFGVRYEAARALGRLRAPSPSVVCALVQALGDPDPWVRSGAVISLENFGPQILPALADLQNDPRPGVRTNAMKTLLAIKKLEP